MTQPASPLRIPETMGPAEIGPYMRSIREHFKITPQDVSERLHIRVRYVNAIEEAKYDLMPGKVYARGYVHTYAEFLGLDPEQVVEQCFKNDLPPSAIKPTPMAHPGPSFAPKQILSASPQSSSGSFLRTMWMPALALVFLLVVITQVMGDSDEAAPVAEVPVAAAATPEALLAPEFDETMPMAQNFECLTGGAYYLTCFYEQRVFDEVVAFDHSSSLPFAPRPTEFKGPVNLSDTTEFLRDE